MSISPQSLATTREKRSSRIPARFDDCEIPEDIACRSIIEPPKTNNTSTAAAKIAANTNTTTAATTKTITTVHHTATATAANNNNATLTASTNATVTTTSSSSAKTIKKVVDGVSIKKSPFHPSITIGNGAYKKVLEEARKLCHLPTDTAQVTPTTPTSISKQSGSKRKKAKGYSLMAKSPSNTQQQSDSSNTNSSTNNQQAKFYNNLTPNMQYGTRLMLNEPIYLPRSVASIAPITTSLQQIVNQSRRPPFLSKKTEAYIKYQDDRKLDYMLSTYQALIKITKYLDVPDLLNLRLVNKQWKSIIDNNNEVWKQIIVRSHYKIDWLKFVHILCKHCTNDLVLDGYMLDLEEGRGSLKIHASFTEVIPSALENLKRIYIRTSDGRQNTFALELLTCLNCTQWSHKIQMIWQVKVVVDDCGAALIPFIIGSIPEIQRTTDVAVLDMLYFYWKNDVFEDPKVPREGPNILIELEEIEKFFNDKGYDLSDDYMLKYIRCLGVKNANVCIEPM